MPRSHQYWLRGKCMSGMCKLSIKINLKLKLKNWNWKNNIFGCRWNWLLPHPLYQWLPLLSLSFGLLRGTQTQNDVSIWVTIANAALKYSILEPLTGLAYISWHKKGEGWSQNQRRQKMCALYIFFPGLNTTPTEFWSAGGWIESPPVCIWRRRYPALLGT